MSAGYMPAKLPTPVIRVKYFRNYVQSCDGGGFMSRCLRCRPVRLRGTKATLGFSKVPFGTRNTKWPQAPVGHHLRHGKVIASEEVDVQPDELSCRRDPGRLDSETYCALVRYRSSQ